METASYPILIIGAGGIVKTAHLPAYVSAGYRVAGIYDISAAAAAALSATFKVPVFESMQELLTAYTPGTIFDIAVPADQLISLLRQLPDGSNVLMQKPMGSSLQEADEILSICRTKQFKAAVNFQLRYAPSVMKAKELIRAGKLGEIVDIEINVNVYTPWHLWTFLNDLPRTEILYHSVHYIDLIRHLAGNPVSVHAKTVAHPDIPQLHSVKSNIIMDYDLPLRASVSTNHCHKFGIAKQHSYISIEGTKAAIRIGMGALINYPEGTGDTCEFIDLNDPEPQWKSLEIEGSWFPEAFAGSMKEIMKAVRNNSVPNHSVEDCIYTMACVEAAYKSSESGGVRI